MRTRYGRRAQSHSWLFFFLAAIILGVLCLNSRFQQGVVATPFAAVFGAVDIPIHLVTQGLASAVTMVVTIPQLREQNDELDRENSRLRSELAQAREAAAVAPRDSALMHLAHAYEKSILADCIGYDPENVQRSILIDQGSLAGVTLDAGVLNDRGVVGRIIAVTPLTSTVLLLNSFASNIPAVVQRGRYWGIARGSLVHVKLDNVALDAPLRIGERVVTGRGRSFPAGIPIGNIIAISRSDAALTQSAVVAPDLDPDRLERVLVLPHLDP